MASDPSAVGEFGSSLLSSSVFGSEGLSTSSLVGFNDLVSFLFSCSLWFWIMFPLIMSCCLRGRFLLLGGLVLRHFLVSQYHHYFLSYLLY